VYSYINRNTEYFTVSRVWSSNWPAFHQEMLAGGRAPDDWQATSYSLAALSGWFSPRRRTSKGCTATQTVQNVGDYVITWQDGCNSLSSRRRLPAVYHHYCYLRSVTVRNDRRYVFRISRGIPYNKRRPCFCKDAQMNSEILPTKWLVTLSVHTI
jgi:hypothetical protein